MIREIQSVHRGLATSDGAGVNLTRIIGHGKMPDLDPFLLLDEFRSDDSSDYMAGFPEHPHRGFETLTYMVEGKFEHKDSYGHHGILGSGGAQRMTAGKGIRHSEMPLMENGLCHGYQLWINLPSKEKMKEPSYKDHPVETFPVIEQNGVKLTLLAGTYDNHTGPVITHQPIFYGDLMFYNNSSICIPVSADWNAMIYVVDGILSAGSQNKEFTKNDLIILSAGDEVQINGHANSRCLLIAGLPVNEPVARGGPFVMNTEMEIRQAFLDYQKGVF